jgi:hypothetical protein
VSAETTARGTAIGAAIATEVTNRDGAIGTAISALTAGAPAVLDTLAELAAALANDAAFSTTVLLKNGATAMTGALNMGGFTVNNLPAPSGTGPAARWHEVTANASALTAANTNWAAADATVALNASNARTAATTAMTTDVDTEVAAAGGGGTPDIVYLEVKLTSAVANTPNTITSASFPNPHSNYWNWGTRTGTYTNTLFTIGATGIYTLHWDCGWNHTSSGSIDEMWFTISGLNEYNGYVKQYNANAGTYNMSTSYTRWLNAGTTIEPTMWTNYASTTYGGAGPSQCRFSIVKVA